MPQILQRQAVHIVTRPGAVEHVGLKHGVKTNASEADSVVVQHGAVILEILSHLVAGRIFQQWAQLLKNALRRELCWRIQVIVC